VRSRSHANCFVHGGRTVHSANLLSPHPISDNMLQPFTQNPCKTVAPAAAAPDVRNRRPIATTNFQASHGQMNNSRRAVLIGIGIGSVLMESRLVAVAEDVPTSPSSTQVGNMLMVLGTPTSHHRHGSLICKSG
jgi:hypothetical protein